MVCLCPEDAVSVVPRLKGMVLEIGFGNGAFLRWLWEQGESPVVGVDLANIAFEKARSRLAGTGVVVVKCEARFFLRYLVAPRSLKEVYILFPDPWPKNKKRRLVDRDFVLLLSSRLEEGGRVFLATDHREYAVQMEESARGVMEVEDWRLPVATKYMEKWRRMGRGYRGFCLVNKSPCDVPFEPALPEVFMRHRITSSVGDVVRMDGSVLKVDGAFCGDEGTVYRLVYSEGPFSHRFFFLQKGDYLVSLNTWGEAYPPVILDLLRRL